MISTKDIIIGFIIGAVACAVFELAATALAKIFAAALVLVQ